MAEHECPDSKCRESLICMINKKVTKVVLLSVTLGLVGVVGYFICYGMAADAKGKEKINQNIKDIAVVQVKIDNIEKTVKRIESKQMTREDIVRAVKEAIGK